MDIAISEVSPERLCQIYADLKKLAADGITICQVTTSNDKGILLHSFVVTTPEKIYVTSSNKNMRVHKSGVIPTPREILNAVLDILGVFPKSK